jgi:hypothetical protein
MENASKFFAQFLNLNFCPLQKLDVEHNERV